MKMKLSSLSRCTRMRHMLTQSPLTIPLILTIRSPDTGWVGSVTPIAGTM